MSGFWYPKRFNGIAGFFGASSTVPVTDWRLPVTDAYDSVGDSTFTAALIASGSAKTLPSPSANIAASSSRTISLKVGAIAAPGAFIYLDFDSGSGATVPTVTVTESFDSTDGNATGTWNSVTFSVQKPSGDSAGTGAARGQGIMLAAGATRWVKLVITANGGTCLPYLGAFQFQSNPALNDLWILNSMSIDNQTCTSRAMRSAIIAAFPGRDPIWINFARAGANGAAIYNECVLPSVSYWPQAYYWVYNVGPNNMAYTGRRPYSADSQKTLCATDMTTAINYLTGQNKRVFVPNVSFGNYGHQGSSVAIQSGGTGYTVGNTLTVVGGTFTSALTLSVTSVSSGVITGVTLTNPNSSATNYRTIPSNPVSVTGGSGSGATFNITWISGVIDNAFPENGNKPYNDEQVHPSISSLAPESWDTRLSVPFVDDYIGQLYSFETYLTDELHNTTAGATAWINRRLPFFRTVYNGTPGTTTLEDLITSTGSPVPPFTKSRLQACFDAATKKVDGSDNTASSSALTNRAALQAQITAISTTYTDPTLTGVAKLPNDGSLSSGTLQWWADFANFNNVFSDAGSTIIAPNGRVQQVNGRESTPTILSQGTSGQRPTWLSNANNGRGGLSFASASTQNVTGNAALQGLMNGSGAAKSFTLFLVAQAVTAGASGSDLMGIANGSTNYLILQFNASSTAMRVFVGDGSGGAFTAAESSGATAGTWCVYGLTFDASTTTNNVRIYRDGTLNVTASSARTAALTGSAFRIGARAGTTSPQYLNGQIGEGIWFNGVLSTGDRQAVEAYLKQKWGTA